MKFPTMKRPGSVLSLLAAVALAFAGSAAFAVTTVTSEPGFDRPGNDYKNFDLPAANAGLCAAECNQDAQCVAYTYVKPGIQGPKARCWLKNAVPMRKANGCCTSGAKVFFRDRADFTIELFKDRPGADYKSFNLSAPDADMCLQACRAESQCRAFTFVAPGIQGPHPRCWLKSTVPAINNDSCCVTGVRIGN